jgi:membrane protein YdbS with pleckstrin-like domain
MKQEDFRWLFTVQWQVLELGIAIIFTYIAYLYVLHAVFEYRNFKVNFPKCCIFHL